MYLDALAHPLKASIEKLRSIILATDSNIGEGIYWNVPTFYYTGSLAPFEPKTYKRYLVGFNFYKNDSIRLIFLNGAAVDDNTGFLTGDFKDGRRLATFNSLEDVQAKEQQLQNTIKQLIEHIKNT